VPSVAASADVEFRRQATEAIAGLTQAPSAYVDVLTAKQKALIVAIESVFTGALAIWILLRFDRLLEPVGIAVVLAIVVAGDIVTLIAMQRLAPTRITVGPGEGPEARGKALTDFESGSGRVSLRGESWEAHCDCAEPIRAGTTVRVIARSGLTLRVEPED
jgi:membrane protein implicated in regulation of membrane protease activity